MGRPVIRIFHNLARSGGTLIGRCLGCMQEVVLLSEIHPRGPSIGDNFNPLTQAAEWYGLINEHDLNLLKVLARPRFADGIKLIDQKCRAHGLRLVLRDWAHLDFMPVPFFQTATDRFGLDDSLKDDFEIRSAALVRHPIDHWISLNGLDVIAKAAMAGRFGVGDFLRGYLRYAEQCAPDTIVRFEDFTHAPERVMQRLCTTLDIEYNPDFVSEFRHFDKLTGDRSATTNSRFQGSDTIRPITPRRVVPALLAEFHQDDHYWRALQLLGYEDQSPA